MEHSSPASKIVATATDTAWAQAYSAGKLHIILSLEGQADTPLASLGKETIEKLQREFFALDEKNLKDLKTVVETVTKTVPENLTLSLIVTTLVQNTLYIVIAHSGSVILKRGDTLSIIGAGKKGELTGFSGNLLPDDLVLCATHALLTTISSDDLKLAFDQKTADALSENLAPLLHEHATGAEAGLTWKMIGLPQQHEETVEEKPQEDNDTLDLQEDGEKKPAFAFPHVPNIRTSIPMNHFGKKQLIIAAIIVLLIVLGLGIFYEKSNRANSQLEKQADAVLSSNMQKYDDAIALQSLNQTLATEELQGIKEDVEKKAVNIPENSTAGKKIKEFLSKVNLALGGNATSPNSQIQVFFDASKNTEIPTVSAITAKGGSVAVIGSKKGGILSADGKVDSTFNGADSIHGITADEKNVYVLTGATVEQITKSNGNAATIIEKQASPISIDTFGGNIYLLSETDKTIYKYRPTSYDKENYFTKDTTLNTASSISIDASVYVVSEGKILKFTRGAADSFTYSGKPLSDKAQVYTDADYTNLYILDPVKKTATVLSKSGDIVKEVSLRGMKNITGIAADEKAKKMYVAADNKIYSIAY